MYDTGSVCVAELTSPGHGRPADHRQGLRSTWHDVVGQALAGWSAVQAASGKRILALGEQMERALIGEPLDFATADAATTAAWWKAAVTCPEHFSHEDRQRW